MKKLIFRKFLKDLTSFLLLVSLSIGLIVWVVQAVNFLDFVSEDGHSFKVYFFYTLLNLPKIFSRILPFIFFISLFYMIIKYENNNELIIFWTIGIKKIDFAKVMIGYSLLYILIQISLSAYFVPKSQDLARSFIRSSNVDFFPSLIKAGKFIDTVSGLTIFIESENSNGEFQNIFLKDELGGSQSDIIYAKNGKIVNQNGSNFLVLNNGKFMNNDNGVVTTFSFEKTEFNLSKYTTKTTVTPKIQELNTSLLIECFLLIKKQENQFFAKFSKSQNTNFGSLKCNKGFLSNLKQEMFKRFYLPFYFPLLTIIACLLITKSKDDYKFTQFKFILFNIGVAIIVLSEVSIRYSGLKPLYSYIFIFIPIILFISTYLYLFNRAKT